MGGALNILDAIETLTRHRAEFIVVGGVAAVLWGAPVSTFDLDIVYRRAGDNIERLAAALRELEAIYRDPAGRRIEPDPARLAHGGHHLLKTRCGPLDVLGTIGAGLSYEDLISQTAELEVAGVEVPVLHLRVVIETKQQTGRDKDLAVLPVLRETLRLIES